MPSKRFSALLGAAVLSIFAGSAHAEYRLSTKMTATPSAQMAGNSWIANCGALEARYEAAGMPRGDSGAIIRQIDDYVKSRMKYKKDSKADESWNSYAAEMLSGKRSIRGDCDDYALTAMTLAICAGIPADRIDFASVQTGPGERSVGKMDHAYAIYKAPDGTEIVFGDTMGKPRKLRSNDKVILRVSAREIGKGMQMSWRSTIPLGKDAKAATVTSGNAK